MSTSSTGATNPMRVPSGEMLGAVRSGLPNSTERGINGVASVVVYDWLGGRRLPLLASRGLTVALGVLVIVAALLAPPMPVLE
mgnify:CR=1 FL=1